MTTATRLQISYVALGVAILIALAELVATMAHVSLGSGWMALALRMAGILWAPAFYAVAVYRRQLERERGG
jgi:hypothetical protein